jgi:glycosyltransferase
LKTIADKPEVSVVTAVRNGSETIRDCIESVQGQSYPVEHVIIDGGSTDGTLEIIEEYRSNLSVVISEPDLGIYDAMNKGIRFATGDVIGTLNADDFYAHDRVIARVAQEFANQIVDASYSDLNYVASCDTRRVVRVWRSRKYRAGGFYRGWMPPHPTFFVRRKVYERYGGFDLGLGSAADYELMLRFLLKHRINAVYIPEVLVNMRCGGVSNRSLKNRLLANRMDRQAWKVNRLTPHPWTLLVKPIRKIDQYLLPFIQKLGSLLQKSFTV